MFAATSAVMFFHPVYARCYSLTFSSLFYFVGYVCTLVVIVLAYSINVGPPASTR